jgi:hypothetical protein
MTERGKKSAMVWLDPDLHAAFKTKLAVDRVTMQMAFERWIKRYTGFKKNVESQPEQKPQ